MTSPIKCLIENCTRPAYIRGLCKICYNGAKYHIKATPITWAQLEELGLALPRKTRGRGMGPGTSLFSQALYKVRNEKI